MVHIKSLIKVDVLSFSQSFILCYWDYSCPLPPLYSASQPLCRKMWLMFSSPPGTLQPCLWLSLTPSHCLNSNAHWGPPCSVAAQWLKLFNPSCLCPFPIPSHPIQLPYSVHWVCQQPLHCAKGFLFQLLLVRALREKEAIILLTVHLRKLRLGEVDRLDQGCRIEK